MTRWDLPVALGERGPIAGREHHAEEGEHGQDGNRWDQEDEVRASQGPAQLVSQKLDCAPASCTRARKKATLRRALWLGAKLRRRSVACELA
jgi:hypothetical protein